MDFKKSLKDVVVLVAICAVFASVLALTNSVTAPIIENMLNAAANEAYIAVMPGATGFEDIDLTEYTLPATVVEAKREKSGLGYAIKLETKGYSAGMVLIVGVDANGVVTGATCIASGETWGLEKTLGDKMVGKDINTVVDVEAGATSLTVNGYRNGVKDAIVAATILGGGSVDLRTEEEIFRDNLEMALPESCGDFTKLFIVEEVDVDAIYVAENGSGYVCVIGDEMYSIKSNFQVDGDTNPSALSAAMKVSATQTVSVDIDEFKNSSETDINRIFRYVNYVQKTGTGNYILEVEASGYNDNIIIKIAIGSNGKILDVQTVNHNETQVFGGEQLKDGMYNASFIGKTEAEAEKIDVISGCTLTTDGFKTAISRAFAAVSIMEAWENEAPKPEYTTLKEIYDNINMYVDQKVTTYGIVTSFDTTNRLVVISYTDENTEKTFDMVIFLGYFYDIDRIFEFGNKVRVVGYLVNFLGEYQICSLDYDPQNPDSPDSTGIIR